MDIFLSRVEQLLPILGQDFLKPVSSPSVKSASSETLYCEIKDVRATGRLSSDGFLVFKGSLAVLEERPSTKKYPQPLIIRNKLVEDGVLTKKPTGLEFTKDFEFSSASAAASVIHGGHANGLVAWKNRDGLSLKDKEALEIS